MSELALDDDQRDALVSHLDGVSVSELVRRESTTDAGEDCGSVPDDGQWLFMLVDDD
jgi:hypothetical protein